MQTLKSKMENICLSVYFEKGRDIDTVISAYVWKSLVDFIQKKMQHIGIEVKCHLKTSMPLMRSVDGSESTTN